MPFNDKTGPTGMGPMTGKRFGTCSGNQLTELNKQNLRCRNRGYQYIGNHQKGIYGMPGFDNFNMRSNSTFTPSKDSNLEQELKLLEEQKKNIQIQVLELEKKINQAKNS